MFESDCGEMIGIEYEKAKQLLVFEKLCRQMERSKEYDARIRTLFRQSTNAAITTKALFQNEYNFELRPDDAARMASWINARLLKQPTRKSISQETKSALVKSQNGECAICGCRIEEYSSKTHVDHIVPWVLVGDELENNYQALCEDCNHKKSNDVSFIFKSMINL